MKRWYLTLWYSVYLLTEYGEKVTLSNIAFVWDRARELVERYQSEIHL